MSEVKRRGRPKKTDIVNKSDLPDDTVKAIVKQKQKRPKRSEDMKVHTEPGEMSRMIMNSMGLREMGMKDIDMTDSKAVDERMNEFLSYCIERDMKPTVESMALAFGTNRMTLWRWKEGVESNLPESSRKAIKRGYDLMNELMTQIMSDGKINPVSAIFLLKNNHNYRDQTEVVVAPSNPYQDGNAGDVRDKYLDGVQNEIQADGNVE